MVCAVFPIDRPNAMMPPVDVPVHHVEVVADAASVEVTALDLAQHCGGQYAAYAASVDRQDAKRLALGPRQRSRSPCRVPLDRRGGWLKALFLFVFQGDVATAAAPFFGHEPPLVK